MIWLMTVLPKLLPAQVSSIDFEKVTIDINGTTEWGTRSIVQDQEGFIWFSSTEGLVKYNGYQPKVYKHIPEDSTSLPYRAGEKLFFDHTGALWISSWEGVSRLDKECDCFVHYRFEVNEHTPAGSNSQSALGFAEDTQQRLWIILQGGLYRYERSKDQFIPFLDDPKAPNSVAKDVLRVILADRKGNIWIGTGYGSPEAGTGLIRFNPETGDVKRFLHDPSDPSSLIDNRVSALLEDQDGRIWVGTYQSGLHQFNPDKDNFIRMMPDPGLLQFKPDNNHFKWAMSDPASPPKLQAPYLEGLQIWGNDPFVQILHQDQSGAYWIGTSGIGLNHFDPHTGKLSFYDPLKGRDRDKGVAWTLHEVVQTTEGGLWGLDRDKGVAWTLHEDRTGSIWVGFLSELGIYKMDQYARKFTLHPDTKAMQLGRESQLEPGKFWIGTQSDGLHLLDINNGVLKKFKHNPKDENSIGHNSVYGVLEDRSGNLWLGLGNAHNNGIMQGEKPGLALMDQKTDRFKHYNIKGKRDNNLVYSIYEDQQGYLWLNTFWGGPFRFDKEKETYKKYVLPGAETEDYKIAIWAIDNDQLWVSDVTRKTLYQYQPETDEFIPFLEGYHATYILKEESGWFWIGTWQQGLLHFNPADGTIEQYTEQDGLPSNEGVHFLQDEKGILWIATRKGLAKMDPKSKKITTDGLPRDYFHVSAFKARDGRLLFGGDKGLLSFYPNQMDGNPFPPRVLLSGLQISGEAFDPGKITEEQLSLSHQQNNFSFEYVAIHYSDPAKNKYQYKLEPFDEDWIEAGAQRNARYTNLKPGAYTFRVKVANSDGVWSEEAAALSFVIHPPWWKTGWAYSLFTLAVLSTIAGVFLRFRNKLKQQQRQLEKEQYFNNRLSALNEANSRFVPTDFLQLLGKESILGLQLGDQVEAKMTILFVDIRSYTTLSERMTPKQNFQFINDFLGRMGPIIKAHGGFISQYFGDGIMALFKNDHHLAIKAAIEMQKNIQLLNTERLWNKQPPIRVGIGLNTGQLMLGVIGDQNRYDSSVISDAVNTASRMEGLTKVFGGTVIVTEKTLWELQPEDMDELTPPFPNLMYRFLGKIKVKGKNEVLKIYDVFEGEAEKVQRQKSETKVNFEKAIHLYFDRKFGMAADLLKVIIKNHPEDQAASYYFERAVKFAVDGVSENWSGVEEMVSK